MELPFVEDYTDATCVASSGGEIPLMLPVK